MKAEQEYDKQARTAMLMCLSHEGKVKTALVLSFFGRAAGLLAVGFLSWLPASSAGYGIVVVGSVVLGLLVYWYRLFVELKLYDNYKAYFNGQLREASPSVDHAQEVKRLRDGIIA